MKTMDYDWFVYVGKRLKEIEAESAANLRRDRSRDDEDDRRRLLYCDPVIRRSRFWYASDDYVTPACFDWDSRRYPHAYRNLLRRIAPLSLIAIAEQPYVPGDDEGIRQENTKAFVARLLLLNMEHLLPQ